MNIQRSEIKTNDYSANQTSSEDSFKSESDTVEKTLHKDLDNHQCNT